MKNLSYLIIVALLSSCVENNVDSTINTREDENRTLSSLLTKSSSIQEDSLTVMSKLQSDTDNLMMNRIIFKDSVFVLALKKEDAVFLGITESTYDIYIDYVNRLNECKQKQ